MRKEIEAVTEFLQEFRDHGFSSAKTDARKDSRKMSWPEVRQRRTTRQCEDDGGMQTRSTAKELFKGWFFLPLINVALVTLGERFSHMGTFYELYRFLGSTDIMRSTETGRKLDECCHRLELRMDDIDAEDLELEIMGAVRSFPTH